MRPSILLALALPLALPLAACGGDEAAPATTPDPVVEATPEPAAAPPAEPLNLNTATSEEFATIPGVGERMVHEFEEYRPYTSIQQFRREIGKYVDEEQVAAYEPYVFVPIDPNESDAETLQQLPGVGPTEAAALEAGRPYDSDGAFLARYGEVADGGDAEAAARYLDSE